VGYEMRLYIQFGRQNDKSEAARPRSILLFNTCVRTEEYGRKGLPELAAM